MKKLIFAAFVAILMGLPINTSDADFRAPMPVDTVDIDINEVFSSDLDPIYRKIKRGDRLWDYVRQYNLANPQEIVEFNKGGVGEKCIKNENLILWGCKIEIPAYTKTAVEATLKLDQAESEKKVGDLVKGARAGYLSLIMLLIYGLIALGVLLAIKHIALNRAWQRAETAEKEKADLEKTLVHIRTELASANQKNTHLENELADYKKLAPGMPFEFASRDHGVVKDAYVILETILDKDGKPTVTKIKCAVCGIEDVKPENSNCNSHYFKQHGTSQDAKPNGWHE